MRDTSEGNIKEMIDQMLFFRGATEEKPRKTTEDATSSNENKTAGHAFLRSVAFPLTTRPVTKLLQPSSLLFYLSYFFPPFFIFFPLSCDFLWRDFFII